MNLAHRPKNHQNASKQPLVTKPHGYSAFHIQLDGYKQEQEVVIESASLSV